MAHKPLAGAEGSHEEFGCEVRAIFDQVEGKRPEMEMEIEEKHPVRTVHVSLDYGTTKVAVAFWIGFPGTLPLDREICDVAFGGHASLAQKVAFSKKRDVDGQERARCHQGDELDVLLRKGVVRQEEVIEYLKLLFYKSHATSELAKNALEQLQKYAAVFRPDDDATPENLKITALALQLRGLMDHVEKAIRTNGEQHFSISPEEIEACPRKIFISVPGMWTPPENRTFTEAAWIAGLKSVYLVSEPQAAAAYWLHKITPTRGEVYKPGDRIQVLDVGGGTSDIIGYEIQETSHHTDGSNRDDHSEAARFKLVSMGNATSRLCGSERINHAFLRWLRKHIGLEHLRDGESDKLLKQLKIEEAVLDRHVDTDFKELNPADAKTVRACYQRGMPKVLQELNLTEAESFDRANREFGRLKEKLDERELQDPVQRIFINGKPISEQEDIDKKVLIKRGVLHSFYEPVLQENFALVRDLMEANPNIRSIFVIGGLRNSSYFMGRLEQEFPGVTIVGAPNSSAGRSHPVARGALWAFSIAQPQDLICADSYGISEDQPLHEDEYGGAHRHGVHLDLIADRGSDAHP